MKIRFEVLGEPAREADLEAFIDDMLHEIVAQFGTVDAFRTALKGDILKMKGPVGESIAVAEVREISHAS